MLKKFSEFLNENIDYTNKIEYSILKPNLAEDQLSDLLNQAMQRNIKYISILPNYLSDVKIFLDKYPVKLSVSIDFPNANNSYKENIKTIKECIILGVDEIDFTINPQIFNLDTEKRIKKYEKTKEELEVISNLCHKNSVIFKLIININSLTLHQIKQLSDLVIETGVDYVQTSTANKTDSKKLKYLRNILPGAVKIKVAGEIMSIDDLKFYDKHADRIATSRLFI